MRDKKQQYVGHQNDKRILEYVVRFEVTHDPLHDAAHQEVVDKELKLQFGSTVQSVECVGKFRGPVREA